jgi:predicted transcriptional regulator
MDEIASWVVFVKMKTSGFTSKMEVKLLKSILIDGGPIKLKAKLEETKRNFAIIDVEILNQKNEICSKGTFTYYTYPQNIAREKFHYPEENAFY